MVTSQPLFRDTIALRLREDLAGPQSEYEVLSDRPTQLYSTGILYPQDSPITPEEDQDRDLAVNIKEDSASDPDTSGVPLYTVLKPSVAGMSFAVNPDDSDVTSAVTFSIRCASYERFAIDEEGEEVSGPPAHRAYERWRRIPYRTTVVVELLSGETRLNLAHAGIDGLDLYVLVTPYAGVLTVTAALSNQRYRGESWVMSEQQHFFQVELSADEVRDGSFVERPSRRVAMDDDSRSAALIYRDVTEYVVGHTCSATAVSVNESYGSVRLKTEWIPSATVASISDKGHDVFDALRDGDASRPLDAAWLAEAADVELAGALAQIVAAYRRWIDEQEQRVRRLPEILRPQARKHLDQCKESADRMDEGVHRIRNDADIRSAFQLSQRAMSLQFSWRQPGQPLVWRPFQIGFQLLVLSSLADRQHPARAIMDLLWFPTGGGKTEAYLALTAFIIFIRRLRATDNDPGTGVVVLMRYTLRLLTIQQFQRAAAVILACELLRRDSEAEGANLPNLGRSAIGIGLWVGSSATPNTLREAVDQSSDSLSTPRQMTSCPACGATLEWKVLRSGSTVKCSSDVSECVLRSSGEYLPIWTIDEEVYQHAPSLVIGTVDKFAQIVRNMNTRVLFGGRTGGGAPPDLIIQDELHLISGPLGSVAGLYEVAIDELCSRENVRPKIVGSTATIRRAEDQIRALFDRDTYQFPSPGLDAGDSGFAVIDETRPGRLYVGVTTAGRSATYMLQALAASLLQAATDPSASPKERNFYWTQVVYFNSLRELGHALVLMQDDVPVSIRQIGGRRCESPRPVGVPSELTSRVPSYEIRDMLDRLAVDANDPESVTLVLASNMISVGIDIPRLGLMVVNAQPKSLSEYIQATSRVGRGEVPGLIVTMYNNMRARDRSHYETFETWHRSFYRDIEATSVTPFASRAQDKALHAVLVALCRHRILGMDRRPVLDDIRRAEVEQLASLIEERVARVDPGERVAVSRKLTQLIDQWASRPDLQVYWNDYRRRTSLLMSAEQFAANSDTDPDLDSDGARRALWPTPNSMRDVEAGTPFILRSLLRARRDR
ncbi:MAG: DNA helicase [Acidimicrobiia bacterium]|nr:DNA helicase [Acidimicrobiia bacterium]